MLKMLQSVIEVCFRILNSYSIACLFIYNSVKFKCKLSLFECFSMIVYAQIRQLEFRESMCIVEYPFIYSKLNYLSRQMKSNQFLKSMYCSSLSDDLMFSLTKITFLHF
ncbi:hypothetical protein ABPG74_012495 [Tetrahymena malaccensis]